MNKDHICFNCTKCIIRSIDRGSNIFHETTCEYFGPTKQQVDGNVVKCEKFDFKHFKGSLKERNKELEKLRSFI